MLSLSGMGGARAGKPGAGRMGRYRELTFHRAGDVPAASRDGGFRESRLGKLLFFLVVLILAVAILSLPIAFPEFLENEDIPSFIPYLGGGSMALFGLVA